MLNEFVNKKNTMGSILKNAEEMQKLKRRLVSDYCSTLNLRISQYSLRGQIIAYYNSILGLLEEFPNIRYCRTAILYRHLFFAIFTLPMIAQKYHCSNKYPVLYLLCMMTLLDCVNL